MWLNLNGRIFAALQSKVAVRIRPLPSNEQKVGSVRTIWKTSETDLVLQEHSDRDNRIKKRPYKFDVVFGPTDNQAEVFAKTLQNLLDKVIDGSTVAVFVYGATGSGKTYTMVGNKKAPGLMDRSLDDLMAKLGGECESLFPMLRLSYIEVYNEKVRDLLQPSVSTVSLREDSYGNLTLQGLSRVEISSRDEGRKLLADGNRRRTRKSTPMNYQSSRAHSILLIAPSEALDRRRHGKLFLVDLAGFERVGKTQHIGIRLKEGGKINRSLLALNNVFASLERDSKYINYRESKLTHLLKDPLTNSAHTVIIANVSPSLRQYEETRNIIGHVHRLMTVSWKARPANVSASRLIADSVPVKQQEKGKEKDKEKDKGKEKEKDRGNEKEKEKGTEKEKDKGKEEAKVKKKKKDEREKKKEKVKEKEDKVIPKLQPLAKSEPPVTSASVTTETTVSAKTDPVPDAREKKDKPPKLQPVFPVEAFDSFQTDIRNNIALLCRSSDTLLSRKYQIRDALVSMFEKQAKLRYELTAVKQQIVDLLLTIAFKTEAKRAYDEHKYYEPNVNLRSVIMVNIQRLTEDVLKLRRRLNWLEKRKAELEAALGTEGEKLASMEQDILSECKMAEHRDIWRLMFKLYRTEAEKIAAFTDIQMLRRQLEKQYSDFNQLRRHVKLSDLVIFEKKNNLRKVGLDPHEKLFQMYQFSKNKIFPVLENNTYDFCQELLNDSIVTKAMKNVEKEEDIP